jgi:hypothetical protein
VAGRPKTRAKREAAGKAKKPPARKAAAKKAPAKKAPAAAKKKAGTGGGGKTPSGPRLNAAAAGLRDSLMVARSVQGWTWPEIAEEAGISVRQAQRAVEERRKATPISINMDPAKVIEQAFEGFMLSVADFERLAAEAGKRDWLAVAVGAKKGANEAREKALALLQVVGRLPEDLSDLRHLIDLRRIAQRMLDGVADFKVAVESGEEPLAAAAALEEVFHELVGIDRPQQLPAAA